MKTLLLIIVCLTIGFYLGTVYQGAKLLEALVKVVNQQEKTDGSVSTDKSISEMIKQTPENLKKLFGVTEPEETEKEAQK